MWNEDVHSGIGRSDYGTYIWASQSGFTDAEARIIAMANNATDAYWAQLPIRGVPGRHLNTAIGRVDTRDLFANLDLQLAINLYKAGDKCGALKTLGRGSHSVQDKIAHGTWPLRWGTHPDWMDDASQRPMELKATEIATKEYFGLFLRGINQ